MKFKTIISVVLFLTTFVFSICKCSWAYGRQSLPVDIVPSYGHRISQVEINAAKKLIVTTSQSGTIKIWKLNDNQSSGLLLRTINSGASIWNFSMSFDGRVIATAHDDLIKVWDVKSGGLLNELTSNGEKFKRVRAVKFLHDDSRLISASEDGSLRIWNTCSDSQNKIITVEEQGLKSIAVSRDEKFLATGDGAGNLKVWSLDNYNLVQQLKSGDAPIWAIGFSPDNKMLAAGGGEIQVVPNKDTTVRLWDVESGMLIRAFDHSSYRIEHLEFSSDGSKLMSIDTQTAYLYNIRGNTVAAFLAFRAGTFDPSSSAVIVAAGDVLHIYSTIDGSLVGEIKAQSKPSLWLATSPDSEIFLTINHKTISSWSKNTGKKLAEILLDESLTGGGVTAKFSPDSRFIAVHYGGSLFSKIELLNPQTLHVLWSKEYVSDRSLFFGNATLSFTPDQKLISLKDYDGVLRLFDLTDENQSRTISFDDGAVIAAKISNDHLFASLILRYVDFNDEDELWQKYPEYSLATYDVSTSALRSKIRLKSDKDRISNINFISSIDLIWSSEYEYGQGSDWIILRDGASGAVKRRINTTSSFRVRSLSHDDRLIALKGDLKSSVHGDFELAILNLRTGRIVQNISGHSERISDVSFTQDNERLVSVADDGTKIWNSTNGDLLATIFNSDDGEWLTITPEGFFAGSENGHELLSVVRGLEDYSVDQFYHALYDPELVKEKLAGDPNNKVLKAAEKLDLAKVLETGAPPRVRILSPSKVSRANGDTVGVTVHVSNNGGGIGRIEFFVNGVNKGKVFGGSGETITKTKELSLASETNTITVVAYNKEGLIASRPVEATVNVDKAVVDKQPTLHVFAVGVEDYKDSRYQLNYAADDVDALSRAFAVVRQDGSRYRDVNFYPLLNKDVTKGNLESQFMELSANVHAHDIFMFFISGHGIAIGRKYFFIPPDFDVAGRELVDAVIEDGISQDDWRDWLGTIKAEKSLLIYDTCEAGDLTEILGRGFGDDNVAAEKLSRATGRALLTASGPSSLALEGYRKQGLLTYAILEGLAVADKDNNGVGLRELFDHVGSRVPELSKWVTKNNAKFKKPYIQEPRRLLRGDDFILASTPITGVLNIDEFPSLQAISTTPTHITTRLTKVYKEPYDKSEVVKVLEKYTLVTRMRDEEPWVLVAKDGKKIGFLHQSKIEVVQ